MKTTVVRKSKDERTEISVTVMQTEARYYVEIYIPRNLFNDTDRVYLQNSDFSIFAVVSSEFKKNPIPINMSFNKGYERKKYGLIKSTQSKLSFENSNIHGFVILNPRFYIPESNRENKKNTKRKKEEKEENKLIQIHTKPHPSGSIYIPYSYNNISRPFRG